MLTVSRRPGRAGVGRHRSLAFGRRDPGRRHGHACGRTDIELSPTDQRSARALRFLDALRYSEKQRIGESFPASRRASRNCPLRIYRSAIQILVRHRVMRTIFASPRSQTFGRLSPAKHNRITRSGSCLSLSSDLASKDKQPDSDRSQHACRR
jgi:hypothetical protein